MNRRNISLQYQQGMTKLDLKLPIIRYGKLKVTNRSISKICYSSLKKKRSVILSAQPTLVMMEVVLNKLEAYPKRRSSMIYALFMEILVDVLVSLVPSCSKFPLRLQKFLLSDDNICCEFFFFLYNLYFFDKKKCRNISIFPCVRYKGKAQISTGAKIKPFKIDFIIFLGLV